MNINWTHPLVCGNPFLMPFIWQMGIMQTLMEAQYVGIGGGPRK
jgi:hypothetical protein